MKTIESVGMSFENIGKLNFIIIKYIFMKYWKIELFP